MKPLLITIPKAGTHLMTQACGGEFCNIPYGSMIYESDPNPQTLEDFATYSVFARTHIPYHPAYEKSLRDNKIRALFVHRDPRDLMVSYYFWVKKLDLDGPSIPGLVPDVRKFLDADDPFLEMIPFWGEHIRRYIPWLFVPEVKAVRYRELIWEPMRTMKSIADYWYEYFGSAEQMLNRVERKRQKSRVFRKGIVGDWKTHFKPRHIEAFYNVISFDMMRFLGYE